MAKLRNPFKSLCKVTKDDNTIPPILSVCRVFKYTRLIMNMTQEHIAGKRTESGESISQSHLSKIERGQLIPTFETLFLYCKLTRIDPKDFLDCVSQTMYMTNLQAAEYIGKKVLKIIMKQDEANN